MTLKIREEVVNNSILKHLIRRYVRIMLLTTLNLRKNYRYLSIVKFSSILVEGEGEFIFSGIKAYREL